MEMGSVYDKMEREGASREVRGRGFWRRDERRLGAGQLCIVPVEGKDRALT